MNSAQDIVKAIKTYIDTPNTKYAVMIDGEWGCGKTYLWENTIYKTIGKKEAIYVSVFGLKDIKDIENELFKTISMVGVDEEDTLKGLLNANTELIEDIKFSGLGYAVQFGLNKYKEHKLKKTKKLFICFDDIERWSGKIEVFLSYVNRLVEHEGVKCLVIGNAREIEENNKIKFNSSKEKTIGFKYKLTYPPNIVLDAAIHMVNFPSDKSKIYTKELIDDNKSRISELLKSVKCSNIRTVSTAIYYLATIYSHNQEKFNISSANAISYFISLLSTIILIEHYRTSDSDKKIILDQNIRNAIKLPEKLGIDELTKDKKLSDEEKRIIELIHNIFYHSDQINHKGKISIITNGFYKDIDFKDDFNEWRKTEDYERYIDLINLS